MKKPVQKSTYPQGIEAFIETLGAADAIVRTLENEGITIYQDGARVKSTRKSH